MTTGERVFGDYLTRCGISFEFEKRHAGRHKRPDFTIRYHDSNCYFDVKDRTRLEVGSGDPYRWFREQIRRAGAQFKEFKGEICAVVLCPANTWSGDFENPDIMLGSMYGDLGVVIPFDRTRDTLDDTLARWSFLNHGKMIRPHWRQPQHTTISALITLRSIPMGQAKLLAYAREHRKKGGAPGEWLQHDTGIDGEERHTGVIVWENAFAAAPFPRDLFLGLYDERWSAIEGSMRRTHLGDGAKDFLNLWNAESS